MIGKTNKLISQQSRKDYAKEAVEETKVFSQSDNEFDGVDEKFEGACA